MAYLVIRTSGGEPSRVELKSAVVFGRSMECGVWLNDPGVSRRHCQIVRDPRDGGWAIEDLNSHNGVYVNKQRITGRHHLGDGDVVRIGPAKVVYHEVGFIPERPRWPMPSLDSVDETLEEVAKPGLPRPRPREKVNGDSGSYPGTSPRPATALPFQRPPAKPIPSSVDGTVDASVDLDRSSDEESFVRRWFRR